MCVALPDPLLLLGPGKFTAQRSFVNQCWASCLGTFDGSVLLSETFAACVARQAGVRLAAQSLGAVGWKDLWEVFTAHPFLGCSFCSGKSTAFFSLV